MPKPLLTISNLRLKNVYSLPTLQGLMLSAFLGLALWYSIFNNSNIERWIFISMLLMMVINLLETSYPFRLVEVNLLPLNPPFSGEEALVNIEIINPTNAKTGHLFVRLVTSNQWIEIKPLPANTSRIISLKTNFQIPGPQALPNIRIKTYADSGLFRFWRNIDVKKEIIVLPKPIDHHIQSNSTNSINEDHDLVGYEEILDPSRFRFADPKLFQKTNRRYQRIFQSRKFSQQIAFNWSDLEKLSKEQKGEQFSYWLKSIDQLQKRKDVDINLQAPFIESQKQVNTLNLPMLKSNFAKWYYAQI